MARGLPEPEKTFFSRVPTHDLALLAAHELQQRLGFLPALILLLSARYPLAVSLPVIIGMHPLLSTAVLLGCCGVHGPLSNNDISRSR
jgi:hypothetical protein